MKANIWPAPAVQANFCPINFRQSPRVQEQLGYFREDKFIENKGLRWGRYG